jgi:hypothetical protein
MKSFNLVACLVAFAFSVSASAQSQTDADKMAAIDRLHVELASCYNTAIKENHSCTGAVIEACREQQQRLLDAVENVSPPPDNRQHAQLKTAVIARNSCP